MLRQTFKYALAGTAFAGAVVTMVEPEITGAAISGAREAFNAGYAMEVDGTFNDYINPASGEVPPSRNVYFDAAAITGSKVAAFQRGWANPTETLANFSLEKTLASYPSVPSR